MYRYDLTQLLWPVRFSLVKTILEALNTDLVCDAINTVMRELFLQIVYGRTQSAFSEGWYGYRCWS